MMKDQKLTDLESHALAHLYHSGPMTGYRLRQLFASSPTNSIAASGGSIYPLLERLQKRGLIRATEAVDQRGSRLLRCSRSGRQAVLQWLQDTTAASILAEDGLRSRAYFIDQLSPAQCRRWLQGSLAACHAKLAVIRAFKDRHPETRGSRWAQNHAEAMMHLRMDWLNHCLQELKEPHQ